MDRIRECFRRAPQGENREVARPPARRIAWAGLVPGARGALAGQPAAGNRTLGRLLDWARNLRHGHAAVAAQVPPLPQPAMPQAVATRLVLPQSLPEDSPPLLRPFAPGPTPTATATATATRDEKSTIPLSPDMRDFFASPATGSPKDRKILFNPPSGPGTPQSRSETAPDDIAFHSAQQEVRNFRPAPDHQYHPQASQLEHLEPGTRLTMRTGSKSYSIEWESYDARRDMAIFRMESSDFSIAGQFKQEPGSSKYLYWMPLYGHRKYGNVEFQIPGQKAT